VSIYYYQYIVASATHLCTLMFARHSHEHTPTLATRALALVIRAEINRPQS